MLLCIGNNAKTVKCKLKYLIASENGIVRKGNFLALIISSCDYYEFQTNIQTCALKLSQDKEILQDMKIFQIMEGLALNGVEVPVEIQGIKVSQDMENFKDLEANITQSTS